MSEQPKIIIDSDWKTQAQAEKQRLEQQEAAKKAQTAAAGESEALRFEDLVGLFATQALSYMGYIPDPQTGQAMISLEYARLNIDMLGVLEAKTKGNLSDDEQKMLQKTLAELRGAFVEVSRAVAKAVQEGRIKPMSGGPRGPGPAPTDIPLTPPPPGLST
ncbi:hypothetical protein PHYC_03574 [Phycisphaerales bacterium]|nr:hypothetical protein PHYC_03574 [Phycisphaerales bacterium]